MYLLQAAGLLCSNARRGLSDPGGDHPVCRPFLTEAGSAFQTLSTMKISGLIVGSWSTFGARWLRREPPRWCPIMPIHPD